MKSSIIYSIKAAVTTYTFGLCLIILLLSAWFLMWRKRRKSFLSLQWPNDLRWVAFHRRCVRFLKTLNYSIPNKKHDPFWAVQNNQILFFATCFHSDIQLDALRFFERKVRLHRRKHGYGVGIVIMLREVPASLTKELAGGHVVAVNYKQLRDIQEFLGMVAPQLEVTRHDVQQVCAWEILKKPL